MDDLRPKIDPRRGDIEDDASSTKRRSLLSLAGSLLAEISIPKLAVAWIWLIVVPSLMLGVAPIVASIWLSKVSDKFATSLAGVWSAILLAGLIALGWFGGHRYFDLPSAASGRSTRSRSSPSIRLAVRRCVISSGTGLRRVTLASRARRCMQPPP